ncbi:hypothetical protein [sulfur-oxidizing endosymbiont of Gigantopelta aegis]|uniref:hypothetical protein n=1 Tax=sulfur-oxidizing endosymbiont of Gigantopelta aegis TaxID=2794934 RepID=UPI0018DCCAEE|nr:hypothetical protein [sulfur-oxidizing endosymbiont of Gigantopelta aegis]
MPFYGCFRSCYYDWVSSPKTDREKENEVMCQHFSGQFSKYFLAVSSDFCHFVFPIILVSHVNFK